MRDPQGHQDQSPPQITNMRNALAKMDVKLPELQQALERGDRALLLTPISEAFAEYNPNAAQAKTNNAGNNLAMNSNKQQTDSNESSRQDVNSLRSFG